MRGTGNETRAIFFVRCGAVEMIAYGGADWVVCAITRRLNGSSACRN